MKQEVAVIVAVAVLVALGMVAGTLWGLYTLVAGLARTSANWWAVAATALLVPAGVLGYFVGNAAARGYEHGADKSVDRLTALVETVVATRDQSRIAVHHALRPVQPDVWTQPAAPQLTFRSVQRDEIDSL